jgi:hypothetical protein
MVCIFLFMCPKLASFFQKDSNSILKFYFGLFLKVLRLKSWFKFDYLKSNSKFPDLKILQKVYLKLS